MINLSIAWGSVPDWCMIVITGITAFYLYKTLQSQKEVQKTQTRLFEIENIKFRESIKPILNYKLSDIKFESSDNTKRVLTIEIENLTSGSALEIKPDHDTNKTQIFIPMDFSSTKDYLVKGDKPILMHFLLNGMGKKLDFVTFSITYQDIGGTKYRQGIFCIDDEHGTEINPFLPEIIR